MSKRILYAASSFRHIRSFHLPYLAQFKELGWTVDVACRGPVAPLEQADQVIEIPFDKHISFWKNRQAFFKLRRLLRQNRYDLVSTHTSLASFFVRLAVLGMKNRPAVACTVHGYLFDSRSSGLRRLLLSGAERITAPVTDLLMTMNQWDEDYAREHHLGRQICKIPGMGVPVSRPSPEVQQKGRELRERWGLTEENFLFVYPAEFSARKRHADLLRALAHTSSDIVLALPGDGELLEECRQLAHQLGLENRVIFPGQSGMGPWYSAADGLVSSTRSEGLPFHIMEAMLLGLPIAASDAKGCADLIRDGENGLSFPCGDSEACARAMQRLYESPELCKALGDRAREDAQSYTLGAALPRVMDCYARLPICK